MKHEPKLDFGPTKKEHGWFYYVWNWKTYVFYALLIAWFNTCIYRPRYRRCSFCYRYIVWT